jgi:pyochelin biosynthetic protein PchC
MPKTDPNDAPSPPGPITTTGDTRWWHLLRGAEPRRATLVCFPFAGGGTTSFASLLGQMPGGVEVVTLRPPGRRPRHCEPAAGSIRELAAAAAAALTPRLVRPYVLFGHSMGALTAFETARALAAAAAAEPAALVVSGRRAPHLAAAGTGLHQLPDDQLTAALSRLGGLPPLPRGLAVQPLLAAVRADLELTERYVYCAGPPLHAPITALGGSDDPLAQEAELHAWGALTTGACHTRILPGSHFFLLEQRQTFGALLRSVLERAVSSFSGT